MDGWEWLAQVDPATIERERFKITAGALKRREGTQLGMLIDRSEDVRVIRARAREYEKQHPIVERAGLHGRLRDAELALLRERRQHAKELAWQQKLSTMGHRIGGPSSLGETA